MSEETPIENQIPKDPNPINDEVKATEIPINPVTIPEEPKPIGRPSIYSQELANKICSQLAEGISLRTVCLAEDMPDKSTVFNWLHENKDFLDQYSRAKEESADAMSEDTLFIADEIPNKVTGNDKSDNARVQAEKIRIDTRHWLMSKMKPKKYGNTLDLTSGGEKLPQPIYAGASTEPKV